MVRVSLAVFLVIIAAGSVSGVMKAGIVCLTLLRRVVAGSAGFLIRMQVIANLSVTMKMRLSVAQVARNAKTEPVSETAPNPVAAGSVKSVVPMARTVSMLRLEKGCAMALRHRNLRLFAPTVIFDVLMVGEELCSVEATATPASFVCKANVLEVKEGAAPVARAMQAREEAPAPWVVIQPIVVATVPRLALQASVTMPPEVIVAFLQDQLFTVAENGNVPELMPAFQGAVIAGPSIRLVGLDLMATASIRRLWEEWSA